MDGEGFLLLMEFVEEDPFCDDDEVMVCSYCLQAKSEPHLPDCLWSRASTYLRGPLDDLNLDDAVTVGAY